MSVLSKCAYNIVRMLLMDATAGREHVLDVIDDVCDNLEIGLQMIFQAVPNRY